MAKLNQIVALVAGKKTRTEKEFGDLNKAAQKPDIFLGLSKQYQPAEDGGETLPSESKFPQKSVTEIVDHARAILTSLIDAVATQEYANTEARANVVVDGAVVLQDVPVTVLMYLEKVLNDMNTFVSNLPTLDPSERWVLNEQTGQYVTDPTKTVRTRKIQRPLVLYPATPEHPAQTQLVTEDITAGHWTTTKYATMMSATEKKAILSRIAAANEAVRMAREEANGIDVKVVLIAAPLLKFVFGS